MWTFNKESFGNKLPTKVDMPLKKKPTQAKKEF